ncbi:MAG: hypothetical protein ACLQVY_09805, partial [Limisphaerales bacterium]
VQLGGPAAQVFGGWVDEKEADMLLCAGEAIGGNLAELPLSPNFGLFNSRSVLSVSSHKNGMGVKWGSKMLSVNSIVI